MSIVELQKSLTEGVDSIAGWLVTKDFDVLGSDIHLDKALYERRGFTAKIGETIWHDVSSTESALLVGIGDLSTCGTERLRRIAAALVKTARHVNTITIDASQLSIGELSSAEIVQALGEGALLGSYRYDAEVVSPPTIALQNVVITGADAIETALGIKRATAIGGVVAVARDLVNTPPSDLTPIDFASRAAAIAARGHLQFEVLDKDALVAGGFGGVLGVPRGSGQEPRFVRCTYEPEEKATVTVALVGKGVTFDSGGLSLKSGEGMMTMKTDMSGAAAVLATLACCRALQIGVCVVGYMPLVENMPGGNAIKPGDVLKIKNGKTIEVLNTDAEGRLILADALSLAEESHPDAIIDLATLTGAVVQALGTAIGGLIGNDDRLIDAVQRASIRAGEPLWPLPLPSDYRSRLDSDVADMRNIPGSGAGGGALTAALVLEEFVGETPWVHLDIAGPARASEDSGYLRKGGTGFGVRTLLELLQCYEALGGVGDRIDRKGGDELVSDGRSDNVNGSSADGGSAANSGNQQVSSEGSAPQPPLTLAIDVGGTGIKASILDKAGKMVADRVRVDTTYPLSPDHFIEVVQKLVQPLPHFDRISMGFPGVVRGGVILTAPHFVTVAGPGTKTDPKLLEAWTKFDAASVIAKRTGKPTRIANDADLQGLAVISGKGLELVVTLGTGVGTGLFEEGRLAPHLELAHHEFRKCETYNEQLGDAAFKEIGMKRWRKRVEKGLAALEALINFDTCYIGGGNARHLTGRLPDHYIIVNNVAGILGGIKLWDDDKQTQGSSVTNAPQSASSSEQ